MSNKGDGWFDYVIEFPNTARFILTQIRYRLNLVDADVIVYNSENKSEAQSMNGSISTGTMSKTTYYSKMIIGW